MSKTDTTNWIRANSGDTTQLDLTRDNIGASHLESARIRWRGVYEEETVYNRDEVVNYDKLFATYPDNPPSPSEFTHNRYYGYTRLRRPSGAGANYTVRFYWDDDNDNYEEVSGSLAVGETKVLTFDYNLPYDARGNRTRIYHDLDSGIEREHTYWYADTVGQRRYSTNDPEVETEGQTTSHTGDLNDGVESSWYDLLGVTTLGTYDLAHSINPQSGDHVGAAEYQVEYTYRPLLPAPDLHEPADNAEEYNRRPWFEFTLTEDSDNDAADYDAKVDINGVIMESKESTGEWEYWDGSAWQSWNGAVAPDTRVRVRPANPLDLGEYTWEASSWDGYDYGYTASRELTILRLPAPALHNPDHSERTEEQQPWFEFTLTAEESYINAKYQARVQWSEHIGGEPVLGEIESTDDISEWQYWDDPNWLGFPSAGVDPGTKVRGRPSALISHGSYYWWAASYDGDYYSQDSSTRRIYIVVSVDAMYSLFIDGEAWEVYSLRVVETSNGEIGEIVFEVNNEGGAALADIDYGDDVELVVRDALGNEENFDGIVREKNPDGHVMTVRCVMGDSILSERLIDQDYSEQDIGVTVKHMIDNYCQPLTSTNVDETTGYERPVQAEDESPIRKLENFRREYGIFYFVDDDWDFHFYKEDAIGSAVVTVRYGE